MYWAHGRWEEALEKYQPPAPRRNFLIVQEIQRGNVYQILTKFTPYYEIKSVFLPILFIVSLFFIEHLLTDKSI